MRLIKLNAANEGNTFEEKIAYSIDEIFTKNSDHHIVKLTFLLASTSKDQFENDFETIVKISKAYFKEHIPAITIAPAKTENDDLFVVESILHSKEFGKVKYKKLFNHHYTVVEYQNSTELFSGSIIFNEPDKLYNTQKTFDFAEQILDAEEMTFDDLYKQNNYLGDISDEKLSTFNQIQEFYYGGAKFTNGKPLNSIIETPFVDLNIDIAALSFGDAETAHASIDENCKYINSCEPQHIICYSSNKNDIELQTLDILKQLFADIEKLYKSNNIDTNRNAQDSVKYVKAFVKNKSYFENVKPHLKQTFPNIPILILESDFINKNHLIQIEGIISL